MIVTNSSNAHLVGRAAALVPLLRERAAPAESARRLAPETFDALAEADVFRMTAPRRFGGFEADFLTQCEVLAELARGCPSTSWVATILSAMSWLAGTFPDEAQEEIYASKDPRISGVFSPTGTAAPKDGGFIVNGRWGYNTGGHGSEWTVVNAVLTTDAGPGMPMCVIVRSRELTRLDDWYASGMAATGSSTIVAENVFVPAHRASIISGNGWARWAGTPVTHLQVGEAALTIESADAHMRLACAELDAHTGETLSMRGRVKARAHVSAATGLARDAVDALFYASGASSIQTHVPIQRFQRDMQALANHAIMHPQTTTELYGRVLCGLEPNTVLY